MLHIIDWVIVFLYFALSLGIAFYYKKRASKSVSEFFLGGRNMPWFLAGVSMVATTFAADTPLAVTELVANYGVSGNWLWWNMLFGGMLTTFFFSRLWRRAEILTELELIELRYGGKPAAFLRGFKAAYLGLFMNALIIGWVNVALLTILHVFFDIPENELIWYAAGAMIITAGYSALSGLWGVAITDAVQFVIAMAGCIVLAVIVLQQPQIGGMEGLVKKIPEESLNFFPSLGADGSGPASLVITIGAFLAFIGVQWWASWYPGSEPGGGGYVAQRMMSTRNEKDSLKATLFFQMANYCLRPWPWIIVGLCSLILYPDLPETDKKLGYVMAMRDFLPYGLKGLLLVAFLAAYMSTISTQLNWGASYLVNDAYMRFVKRKESFNSAAAAEKHYVLAGRIITLLIMLVALFATSQIRSISGVWEFIIECGAGLGLVLILRWYYWRINAWSEITATFVPFLIYGICKLWIEPIAGQNFMDNKGTFFVTVGMTTLSWLVVTYLTPPENEYTLKNFYHKVRPDGNWGAFAAGVNPTQNSTLPALFMCWISAISLTYAVLFASGKFLFLQYREAALWSLVALISLISLRIFMNKTTFTDVNTSK